MKKTALIFIWILTFILILMLNRMMPIIALVYAPASNTSKPTLFVLIHDEDVEILDADQVRNRFPGNTSPILNVDAILRYYPKHVAGPLEGWIEYMDTQSFLADSTSLWALPRKGIPKPTQAEIDRAYAAALEYAKADPSVTQYHPGEPPVTQFSFVLLAKSIAWLVALFGVPTLFVYLTHLYLRMIHRKIISGRRDSGKCIHCSYDCKKLQSPTCPECGEPHTVPTESPIPESNA